MVMLATNGTNRPVITSYLLSLVLCLIAVSGCDIGGGNLCSGRVEQIRPLPDSLTMTLGQELYLHSLIDPPVFEHTEGRHISFNASVGDRSIAFAGYGTSVLRIYPRGVGSTTVYVGAYENTECGNGTVASIALEVIKENPETSS